MTEVLISSWIASCHNCFRSETSLLRCLLKDAGILWEKGLVALSFSLQSVFAFFCLLARKSWQCHATGFLTKETSLLVAWNRSAVPVNGQCSAELLGLPVTYTTQRSCITSEPLLYVLCTLFLNKIRYHDLENRVSKNWYGFKMGIFASNV